MKDFYAYDEEIKRRQAQTPKWTGKIVRTAGEFKKLESHEEIMSIWGLSSVVKDSLRNFLRFCYVNGRLVTNSKLEGILLELTENYPSDNDKCEAIEKAINGGFYDIKRYPAVLTGGT
jgi:DNA mismatch repair ATPase MutL